MSLEAYIWAASLPLSRCSGTAFRVLLQLADRADPAGYGAYPSVGTIAETLECSDRTVQRALKELRIGGLIREGDQRYVQHLEARYRPTVYDLLTPALSIREHFASRGVAGVTPGAFRGDKNMHSGATTGVTQTVHEPTYQDSQHHLSLVTARESAMSR